MIKNYSPDFEFPAHWWPGLLLMSGVGCFWSAWKNYSSHAATSRRNLRAGIILTTIGCIFLTGIHIDKLWPLILVAVGFTAVLFPKGRQMDFAGN